MAGSRDQAEFLEVGHRTGHGLASDAQHLREFFVSEVVREVQPVIFEVMHQMLVLLGGGMKSRCSVALLSMIPPTPSYTTPQRVGEFV